MTRAQDPARSGRAVRLGERTGTVLWGRVRRLREPLPVTPAGRPCHYRFVYLLAAQLALLLVFPFFVGDRPRPGVAGAFMLVLFVAALWTVASDRRSRIVAALLVSPAIANLLLAARAGHEVFVAGVAFGILFLVFVTAVIFRGVIASPVVTTETLYGAITAYLLLGLTWAWTYGLVEQLHPGSFRSLVAADGRVFGPDFTFLSFITLTSVGYGDIVPVSGHAKSLAILEAITGQMYLAVFIARLVGLHGQAVPRTSAPGEDR